MKNNYKLYYQIVLGLFSVLILLTVYNFIFNYEDTSYSFAKLGISTIIIYPLAVLKVLGLIAIWSRISPMLIEWAYAGFFFDIALALMLHYSIGDGQWFMAVIALILLIAAYGLNYQTFIRSKT
jgi:hypothetical protein